MDSENERGKKLTEGPTGLNLQTLDSVYRNYAKMYLKLMLTQMLSPVKIIL